MKTILGTKIPDTHPYVYETHLHTKQGSACSKSDAADMARACKEAGYTGMFVSDHFFYGNTAVDRSLPWKEWVENYCKGYEVAKEEGDRIGLSVFFAWESSYDGIDFLIYGLDKEWLINHPEIRDASVARQYEMVHADVRIVIQAHPYRVADYIKEIKVYPDYVDGVEVYNASHDARTGKIGEANLKAVAYAKKHHFPMTAGSDVHTVDLIGGGMAFDHKLESVEDFMQSVLKGDNFLLPYGNTSIF